MRKRFMIILAVLIVSLMSVGVVSGAEFINSFEGAGTATNVIQLSDGNLLYGLTSGAVIKTDTDGVVIWQKDYSGMRNVIQIIESSSGGYLVLDTKKISSVRGDTRLTKLDADGNVQWAKEYSWSIESGSSSSVPGSGLSIADVKDSSGNPDGYIMAGMRASGTPRFIHALWLARLDADGVILWDKVYGDAGVQQVWAGWVEQTLDGGYAFSGERGGGASFSKTDENGTLLFSFRYDTAGGRVDSFDDFFQEPDGSYIIVGHRNDVSSFRPMDILFVKLNSNGAVNFSRSYGGPGDENRGVGSVPWLKFGQGNLDKTPSGNYVISGHTTLGSSGAMLLIIDPNGNIVDAKTYGSGVAQSVAALSGGGFVFTGSSTSPAKNIQFCQEPADPPRAVQVGVDGSGGQAGACVAVTDTTVPVTSLSMSFGGGYATADKFTTVTTIVHTVTDLNLLNGQVCPAGCGDGIHRTGEECDDGNLVNGDGCSSVCLLEDNDGDGVLDVDEDKFGTDPRDADAYPLKIRVDTFGQLLISINSYGARYFHPSPSIRKLPSVFAKITSVKDQNGNPVTLLRNSRNSCGVPDSNPRSNREYIVAKTAAMTSLKVDLERTVRLGAKRTNTKTLTDSVSLNLVGAPPIPGGPTTNSTVFGIEVRIFSRGSYNTGPTAAVVADGGTEGSLQEGTLPLDPENNPFTEAGDLPSDDQPSEPTIAYSYEPLAECCFHETNSSPTGYAWDLTDGTWTPVELHTVSKKSLKGSLLDIYDPVDLVVEDGEVFVPIVYDTPDNYWEITTTFTPPAGCTVVEQTQSTVVDQDSEVLLFTMNCNGSSGNLITGLATGNLPGQASDQAKVVHNVGDCTKPGCPPQVAASTIAVHGLTNAKSKANERAKQVAPPLQGATTTKQPATRSVAPNAPAPSAEPSPWTQLYTSAASWVFELAVGLLLLFLVVGVVAFEGRKD